MIFEVKKEDKVFKIDDLKPFAQQTKTFQKAFNEAEKITIDSCVVADFDNATVSVFFENRVIVSPKETESDENI